MNVYKIELLYADEYSDPSKIADNITEVIGDNVDEGEMVFVKILSCKKQEIDIQHLLFESFDESKSVNVLVK